MKKKIWIIIGGIVLAAALAAAGILFLPKLFGSSGSQSTGTGVYVDQAGSLAGLDLAGGLDFTGVVETEKATEVKYDRDKTLKEVLVTEGQEVEVGDPLFSYDVDVMDLKLRQAQIEYDSIQNKIDTLKAQLDSLGKEKAKASADQQLSYSLEIEGVELDIRTEEYNLTIKENEIATIQSSIENSVVYSEVSGIVSKVADTNDSSESSSESSDVLVSIVGNREYKVKSSVSELNMASIYVDMPVYVTSRVDPSQTWTGTITEIETTPESDSSEDMYGTGDTMTKASEYNFYITLDSADGLILGQHVYVSTGTPGEEDADETLMLPSMYVVTDDGDPYVYAENASGKIEKRTVELGAEDTDMGTVEIVSGLTAEDYIAYPADVQEGASALHYSDNFAE